MDNRTNTDDDRQTPSTDQASSDALSSLSSETLLPAHENDQPHLANTSHVRVRTIKVENRNYLPNLNIKHPNRPDDHRNDPFNGEKRVIVDRHVKLCHINRSNLRHSTPKISPLKLGETNGAATVSRVKPRLSRSINNDRNNRETKEIKSRESTVRITRTSTATYKNQDANKKVITSKPLVARVPFDKLPLKKKHKELHVSVQHVTVNSKKSSS